MAQIVHSDLAPAELVHYVINGVEFDLGGTTKATKSFDTDDEAVLSNAEAHPWLKVNRPPVSPLEGTYVEQVAPADDPLSFVNGWKCNDPAEVTKAEEAKAAARAALFPPAPEAPAEVVAQDTSADETTTTSKDS